VRHMPDHLRQSRPEQRFQRIPLGFGRHRGGL
jgi:hypothetical protein